MFELSDDEDEHFWNDIPLHDVTEKNSVKNLDVKRPQLRVPDSSCISQPSKKLCTDKQFVRDKVESPYNNKDASNTKENNFKRSSSHSSGFTSRSPEGCSNLISTVTINDSKQRQISTPLIHTRTRSHDNGKKTPSTSNDMSVDYITPTRKRKFPGPAGVLPKLMPGQSVDIGLHTSTPEIQQKEKSPQEETVVLSSQSSENLFTDDPWQELNKDIGEEGLTIMRKFSIASTLLKAGKKQLYQGKAWLLFGVIEGIENLGSEASVSIKDRSGKMHGTIHNDLMTEYEAELQVGTVLVLKQVSIISVSNKNHYLNITPNNLVCLYHIKDNTLKSLHFHGSQDSLHSVLRALEKESMAKKNICDQVSSFSESRRSLDGSGSSTPVLSTGTPDSLNKRLFNTCSPSYSTHNRLDRVRDVSVIPRNSSVTTNTHYLNKPVNSPCALTNKRPNLSENVNTTKFGANSVNNSNSVLNRSTVQNSNCIIPNSALNDKTNGTVVQAPPKWRFRQPSCSAANSPDIHSNNTLNSATLGTPNTNPTHFEQRLVYNRSSSSGSNEKTTSIGRSCQLQVQTRTSQGVTEMPSDVNKLVNTMIKKQDSMCTNSSDLWEDDLSDEILSQLTDDMT